MNPLAMRSCSSVSGVTCLPPVMTWMGSPGTMAFMANRIIVTPMNTGMNCSTRLSMYFAMRTTPKRGSGVWRAQAHATP